MFAKATNGFYDHVATLVASNGASLGDFAISGRNVIARCGDGEACYFELPASLTQPRAAGDLPRHDADGLDAQFRQPVQYRAERRQSRAATGRDRLPTHTAVLTASN